ncbi:MAG: type II CAAX prenyl endopeptidase Rce1 family protein [Christensenellaceae bacterium]
MKEKQGGIVFTLAAIVPILVAVVFLGLVQAFAPEGYETQEWYLYATFLLNQVCFVGIIAVTLLATKTPVKELGVRPCAAKYFFYALLVQLGLMFALSWVNNLFVELLGELFGYEPTDTVLPSLEGFGFVGVTLIVAVLPAICEELLFRGFLVRALEKTGTLACVLLSGLLFSLFHQNPPQTIYQFICGCVYALVAIRSGSVLPTMAMHFFNNFFVILVYRFSEGMSMWLTAGLVISSAGMLIAGLLGLIVHEKRGFRREGKAGTFFLFSAVGILVCAVMWIAELCLGIAV